MNTYEKLQDKACKDGIDVIDIRSIAIESMGYIATARLLSEKILKHRPKRHASWPKNLVTTIPVMETLSI